MFARSIRFSAVRFCIQNQCRSKSNLSYIDNRTSGTLRPISVGQLLSEAVQKYGHRTAIFSIEQDKKLNFSELLELADRFAAGLKSIGLKCGDRVGIWAPNLLEWHVANMACARAGLVTVAINPALQAKELEYTLNKSEARCLLFSEISRNKNNFEILESIFPNSGERKNSERVPSLEYLICISDDSRCGMLTYNEVMDKPDRNEVIAIKKNQDSINTHDLCNIQFTSGTTGMPKAIPRTHYQMINNGYFTGKRLQLDLKEHSFCFQVPMFHAFGLLVVMMSANFGAGIVYPSIFYSPEKTLAAIENHRLSALIGTPTMFIDALIQQKRKEANVNLELTLTGGASIAPELAKNIRCAFKVNQVYSMYGMTEVLSSFFSLPGDNLERQTSTVGHIIDGIEVKVIDSESNVVPFGVPGELCIRGYTVLHSYIGDPEKTKEILDQDGWLRTGDRFVLTADGYGRVVGRIKDVINRGGEKINPQEVEYCLMTHPKIKEVAVIGLPHDRLGEDVCACIILKPGCSIAHGEIKEFCKGKLAYFKIPGSVVMMDDFPKTLSGKIQKFKLLERIVNRK